jgi:hypothetical protein
MRHALPALLMLAPAAAMAGCMDGEKNRLWNYQGTIGGKYKIGMTLVFTGDAVTGEYFYASQRKDIALRGNAADQAAVVLDELDPSGAVSARIEGAFSKECGQFDGTWQKTGSGDKLPLTATLSNGSSGKLDRRYAVVGDATDALVHANATRFWLGVKNGNKKDVAATLAYPVRAQVKGQKKTLRNAKEFLAVYDQVFTASYRQAVVNSVPHNMSASWRGIMLGENGEVWLDAKGKPFAFNN